MLRITRSLLETCLAAAKSAYPNEFIGLLEGERQKSPDGKSFSLTLKRLIVPPGISVSPSFSYYSEWLLPVMPDVWGSFHSHPGTKNNRPSRADLHAFSNEGGVHLIAAEPFGPENIAAYGHEGKKLEFEIVD